YGAGGSSAQQQITCQIASRIKQRGVEPLAHLTCINSERTQIDEMLGLLRTAGIENILALRGDRIPELPPVHDFEHASDLIGYIAGQGGFDIAAACYPEGHPDSDSVVQDIGYVREKALRGASHLISQLFFDNEDFYRLQELLGVAGVNVPVHAGVMPVVNAKQIERMVSLCGAKLPGKFAKIMARYGGNSQAMYDAGVCYATEQVVDLIASGVDGIHLYTMNNPAIAEAICGSVKSLIDSANEASA
ncbi:MAG: methylenetetrahydrofolate reductase, partial [Oscillospiraceae bacterium]